MSKFKALHIATLGFKCEKSNDGFNIQLSDDSFSLIAMAVSAWLDDNNRPQGYGDATQNWDRLSEIGKGMRAALIDSDKCEV